MNIPDMEAILLWIFAINYAILLLWFALVVFFHDAMHRLLSRWFRLSVEAFDTINLAGITLYKIGNLLFVGAPLLALYLHGRA